jgi:hypothetical protein
MIEFITAHWTSILAVLIFIMVIIFLALRGKKQIIYKMLYTLVTEAEKQYGEGTGSIKFAEVMTKIYSMLPTVIKIFITYDTLARWIEDALAEAKDRWKKEAGII